MRSLTDIANQYGTDKGTKGPSGEWGAHNYTDVYQAYLEELRYEPITLLEIGLGVLGDRWHSGIVHGRNMGGASIKTWHDYFPNARIFGIDVNACAYLDNQRVKTAVVDQGDVKQLKSFMDSIGCPKFDVIIDDGSHRPDHQQISLSFFFRHLRPGGYYFIEDLASNGLGDNRGGRHSSDSVINTRSVLKSFNDVGSFQAPNALADAEYLAQNIRYMNFHAPEPSVQVSRKISLRQPARGIFRYQDGEERICLLRKKL